MYKIFCWYFVAKKWFGYSYRKHLLEMFQKQKQHIKTTCAVFEYEYCTTFYQYALNQRSPVHSGKVKGVQAQMYQVILHFIKGENGSGDDVSSLSRFTNRVIVFP